MTARKTQPSSDECRSCGACCLPSWSDPAYVSLTESDIKRLPPRYHLHISRGGELATKVSEAKAGPHKGAEVCSCVALRGSVGHRVSCAIYESRPELCRSFKPGSLACRDAREMLSLDGAV